MHTMRTQTDWHLFNGFFSRTTWVSRHQKGQTNLDFNEARDDGVAVASAAPYANHLNLAPDKNHASISTLNFLQAGCSSWCPTNSVKALKAMQRAQTHLHIHPCWTSWRIWTTVCHVYSSQRAACTCRLACCLWNIQPFWRQCPRQTSKTTLMNAGSYFWQEQTLQWQTRATLRVCELDILNNSPVTLTGATIPHWQPPLCMCRSKLGRISGPKGQNWGPTGQE